VKGREGGGRGRKVGGRKGAEGAILKSGQS